MHRKTRLKVNPSLNPHLICVLCGGYLIDATTIVECLHSFCKTCIVRYLESSKFCPICDVQVHKTKPFTNIRLDHTLQDLVYKLVPGLFQNEMKRRRDFYRDRGQDVDSWWNDPNRPEYYTDDDGEIQRERVIFAEDEQISLALQLSPDGKPPRIPSKCTDKKDKEAEDCRYLLCPAAVTIGLLKKFIRLKFSLNDRYQIDIYHTDEVLSDCYTLVDIAYIYMWRRKGPLYLHYTVYTNPAKRFKRDLSCTETFETEKVSKEPVTVETEIKNDVEDGKPENDGDKSEEMESEKPTPSLLSLQDTVPETKIQKPSEKPIVEIDSSELTNDIKEKPTEPSSETAESSVPKNDIQPLTSNAPMHEPQKKDQISLDTYKLAPSENGFEVAKSCRDKSSNKANASPVGTEKTSSNGISTPPSTINKSPGKKDKICSNKSEKQLQTQSLKPSSAILVVPSSENSSSVNRIPKLKLNTSKYSSQGIVTKKATLTTPVYHPRMVQKSSPSPTGEQGAEKSPASEKMAKKMCTQNNGANSSPDKVKEKKTDSPKSSPSKKLTSDKTATGTSNKSPPTAKHKLLQNSSSKTVSHINVKNAKTSASKSSIVGAKANSTAAAPNVTSKQESKFTNGQKLKLTVPYSSYGCYTNGLTIPSPIGFSPTVTSPRPFPSSPLNRPLSPSPTRRKTSSPSRRVPSTTANGRLTPGSCVSPSSLYSLSPSPTSRSFPTSPSPHSFNPTARMIPTSPLARHISSTTGRIFSFPERGPPISHLPITVPVAHSHLNLRLNTSPLYSSNASPHNGDLPQDLSIKKKTASNDESKTPSSTLKIPIKVPIKTNGLPSSEIDKFAFTDDEEDISPLASRKLHPIKAEPESGM